LLIKIVVFFLEIQILVGNFAKKVLKNSKGNFGKGVVLLEILGN
jgi:hypothetical protein